MNRIAACLLGGLGALAVAFCANAASPARGWVASWASSPQPGDDENPLSKVDGQTVRERMRVSVGGDRLRVRLSNLYGTAPVTLGAASLALAGETAADISPGSIHRLTFAGRGSVTLKPGATRLSDPVRLNLPAGGELSLSLYFSGPAGLADQHDLALKRAVITPRGDFTQAAHVEALTATNSSVLVSAILVPARAHQRLVAALGDSITDGAASTPEGDRGWPSVLTQRLEKLEPNGATAVVNEGIAGNQLIHDGIGASALSRFDSDVLALPGLTHVVVLEGINDISWPGASLNGHLLAPAADEPTLEAVIGAYKQLIVRAHRHRIKLIGATLTPCEGAALPGYYSEAKEQLRQAINTWIRASGAFDGVIDFDATLRDPEHPSRLQARYASPDHLHPNDAGYQAMAETVDLKLLR